MYVDICENVSHVGNQLLPLERLFYCYQGYKRDLSLEELNALKSDCGMGNGMELVEVSTGITHQVESRTANNCYQVFLSIDVFVSITKELNM